MIGRYTTPKMASLWSDERRYALWRMVELRHLRFVNRVPADVESEAARIATPNPARVLEHEQRCHHEFEAFLRAWMSNSDAPSRELQRWLHFGMTSSDVQDTALAITLLDAHYLIKSALNRCHNALFPLRSMTNPQLARTHGQPAVVSLAGSKWAHLAAMCHRWKTRIDYASLSLGRAAISGPVGDFTAISRAESTTIIRSLGLAHDDCPTQIVARDGLAHWCATLAGIATWCEAVVTEIRLLAHGDVGEVSEHFAAGQVGSSAMAHKHNPIHSENLCGLARLARSNSDAIQLGQIQWHHRDLAHSAVERVALPDLACVVEFMLVRLTTLLQGLEFHPNVSQYNIVRSAGVRSFERTCQLIQEQGLTREEARAMIGSGGAPATLDSEASNS